MHGSICFHLEHIYSAQGSTEADMYMNNEGDLYRIKWSGMQNNEGRRTAESEILFEFTGIHITVLSGTISGE